MTRAQFVDAFVKSSDGISVPFTTLDGKEQVWKLGGADKTKEGVKIFVIPWEEADPSANSEFSEIHEKPQFGNIAWRITGFVDADGYLVIKASIQDTKNPGDTSHITDEEYLAMFLNYIETLIEHPKIPDLNKGWTTGDRSDLVMSATKWASHPFFEIIRK